MSSICRDSRRVGGQGERRRSEPISPVPSRTTSTADCIEGSNISEYAVLNYGKSESYPDEKNQQQPLLPLHSQDVSKPLKSKRRKRNIAQSMTPFVVSFGATWILLNTLFGRNSALMARTGGTASSSMTWRGIIPWSSGKKAELVRLRPLSVEAQNIKNRCQSLPPFPEEVYRDRISRLRDVLRDIHRDTYSQPPLAEDVAAGDIYILEPGASSQYYTGIGSQEWHKSERPFLFLVSYRTDDKDSKRKTVLSILTPAFEAARAKLLDLPGLDKEREVEYIEWREEENWADVLVRHLNAQTETTRADNVFGAPRELKLHFDPAVRSFISAGIAHAVVAAGNEGSWTRIATDVANPRILSVRERKSREEIAVLRCANELTLQAIKATKDAMFFGIRESQTSSLLSRYFEELGMPGGEGLVLFGENAALPHGTGTDRTLKEEDFALIDAGGLFRGYTSDITRTFALSGSKISDTQDRLWYLVKEAQTAALQAGNEGTLGKDVDAAARDLIISKGKRRAEREGFTHRLGHGIGLEGHESPYLVGSNDQPIERGNVFSDEPGIYILGEIGIRLEDCWFVNEEGKGELLTEQAKDYWTV